MGTRIVFSLIFTCKLFQRYVVFFLDLFSIYTLYVEFVLVDEKLYFYHKGELVLHSSIAVVFCGHRCRTSRWNVLDATSVAGTQVHRRRTTSPKRSQSTKWQLNWNPLWKREANEVANSKRIKPNPKPQIRIPKKSVRPAMPSNQALKKRPRASMGSPGPPSEPPPKRFKPNQSKLSSFLPSRK